MTSQIQILRRQELDAFLATAFSNDLMNALQLQEMTVSVKNVSTKFFLDNSLFRTFTIDVNYFFYTVGERH